MSPHDTRCLPQALLSLEYAEGPLNPPLNSPLFKILPSLLPCSLGRHRSYKGPLLSGGSFKVRPRWVYHIRVRRIRAPKEPLNI